MTFSSDDEKLRSGIAEFHCFLKCTQLQGLQSECKQIRGLRSWAIGKYQIAI